MDSLVRDLADKINALDLSHIKVKEELPSSTITIQDELRRAHVFIETGDEESARECVNTVVKLAHEIEDIETSNQVELCWGLLNERIGAEKFGGERGQYLRQAANHYSTCLQSGGVTKDFGVPTRDNRCETRLGTVHLLLGELSEAENWFSKVLEKDANSMEAILGMAETALFLGRYEEALSMVEPLLSQGLPDPWIIGTSASDMLERPDDVVMFAAEAEKYCDVGFVSHHRKLQLEALVCAANIYQGRPSSGPGVLGVISDLMAGVPESNSHSIGKTPNALGVRTLVRNTMLAGQVHLLDSLFTARAESVLPGIKGIIEEVLSELDLVVNDDGEPDFIFIGGSGRCGTTLMRTMLNSHSRIHCGPERKLITSISAFRNQWVINLQQYLSDSGVSVNALDEATAAFIETLMKSTSDGSPRIAEKTPTVLLHAKFISSSFPRAKFIHLIRDARAVVASLLRQDWMDVNTGKPLEFCESVEAATQYWIDMVVAIRSECSEMGESYLEVRYEDLVLDSKVVSNTVLAFLGEPWEDGLLEHHQHQHELPESESSSNDVMRPVYTGAVYRWKDDLTPEQIATIESMAGPLLRELGYLA